MVVRFLNEGTVLFVVGILGAREGLRLLPVAKVTYEPLGPGWYLLLLSLVLAIGGAYCWFDLARKGREARKDDSSAGSGRATLAMVVFLIYVALVPLVGYLPATIAFLGVVLRVFGETSPAKSIVLPVVTAVILWFGFERLAQIPLP